MKRLPYMGNNLLLLEELKQELALMGIDVSQVLFRASQLSDLERIQRYGTDRGGFSENRTWRHDCSIPHEEVIYATTAEQIIIGESDLSYSTSLKKLSIINEPLILIYDRNKFDQLRDTEFRFQNTAAKPIALLEIFQIGKVPEIQGWFSSDDGLFYRQLISGICDGVVIELGCWKGLSTSFIGRACNVNGTRLVCVDAYAGSSDTYNMAYREMIATDNPEMQFRRNMKAYGIEAELIKAHSEEAIKRFDKESADLVFIDTSHDYDAVSAELSRWYPVVCKGGVLAGHDFNEKHDGVRRALLEFSELMGLEFQTGGCSIWVIRK